MRKIYFCHQYREHTNSLGNSMACQREALQKMLDQWEMAAVHESDEAQNELHIMGDFNLDCYNGKWLHPKYSLRSLAKMVNERCNVKNMSQLVDKITRIQYNSISRELSSSCLDHVYSNAVFRLSDVRVVSTGSSDHDAIVYTRYAKVPPPPRRTIRKRSYKNFVEADFIKDVASLDFGDIYMCRDVDYAANLLTSKLLEVLNIHAPWIIFQERKHFTPWITPETLELMQERDSVKSEARSLSNLNSNDSQKYGKNTENCETKLITNQMGGK